MMMMMIQAKYNGLMTQSDKDFITRIQVSQLVNTLGPDGSHDPYADDFYYQVFKAIRQSRTGTTTAGAGQQPQQQQPVSSGSEGAAAAAGGAGAEGGQQQKPERRLTRRENAMLRMAQQVQRIVQDAKNRPKSNQGEEDGTLHIFCHTDKN
jgi:DNA topoisomerase 2-associated protein PAT1